LVRDMLCVSCIRRRRAAMPGLMRSGASIEIYWKSSVDFLCMFGGYVEVDLRPWSPNYLYSTGMR
jgi:hypothetical protein